MQPRHLAAAIGMLAFVIIPTATEAKPRKVKIITCDRFGCAPTHVKRPAPIGVLRQAHYPISRPAGCPSLWCGCWAALKFLGLSPRESKRRGLWRARAWAQIGRPAAGPAPGVIAVFARGRRGGHVGIIRRVTGASRIVLLSGNDGGRVRQRERSTARVIAYRRI
ncbi:MAG: hypothetical protein GEU91_18365 [Rhizobiales bacterium]|nr:hypothetical protein [Hyphomicrobiales bacterium]